MDVALIQWLSDEELRRAPAEPVLGRDGLLEFDGSRTHLSSIQADLMSLLIERFGAVVSREALMSAAWPDTDPTDNILDVTIGRLRGRIGAVGLCIRTVRSRGYLLTPVDSGR